MTDSSTNSPKFPYGVQFQYEVIRLMMIDMGFCAKACDFLQDGYFTGELRWFFRKAKEYYVSFSTPPTSSYLSSEILKQADLQNYENIRAAIEASKPDSDYIKKELTGFIRANKYIAGYKDAANLYNAGRMEGAFELTFNLMQDLIKVDFQKERHTEFGDAQAVLNKARFQKSNAIPTGIIPIDEAMQGGLMPQTWTTFLGGSNVGKSLLGATLAYNAVSVGKKVFITVHEDEEEPTKMRFLSRFSGVPYNRLFLPWDELKESERESIKKADEWLVGNVRLRFMYGSENTIENLKKTAIAMHRDWPFDLYICDYGQCLGSDQFKSMDNSYKIQGYVYGELKQLCLELGVAGAGGAQVNREGMKMSKSGGDFLRMTDVGDSIEICRKSSNVITINRSDAHVRANRIVYLLDKVRNGRCPVAVECANDYSMCATHLGRFDFSANEDGTLTNMEMSQREIPVGSGPTLVQEEARGGR